MYFQIFQEYRNKQQQKQRATLPGSVGGEPPSPTPPPQSPLLLSPSGASPLHSPAPVAQHNTTSPGNPSLSPSPRMGTPQSQQVNIFVALGRNL